MGVRLMGSDDERTSGFFQKALMAAWPKQTVPPHLAFAETRLVEIWFLLFERPGHSIGKHSEAICCKSASMLLSGGLIVMT